MKYFAYGSNMSIVRLQKRVPSAIRIGTFSLSEHQLRFNKAGKDGSGKCDAYQTNNSNDVIIGSLFEIDDAEKIYLDKAEGLGYGYDEKIVTVQSSTGESLTALTYFALKIDSSLKPYSWYLNHVVTGAKEINMPEQYLKKIESIVCLEDPNKERNAKQRAMYL